MVAIFPVYRSMSVTLSKAVRLLYASVLCFVMFDVAAVQREIEVFNKAIHQASRHTCKVNEMTALEAVSREEHQTQLPSCRSAHSLTPSFLDTST